MQGVKFYGTVFVFVFGIVTSTSGSRRSNQIPEVGQSSEDDLQTFVNSLFQNILSSVEYQPPTDNNHNDSPPSTALELPSLLHYVVSKNNQILQNKSNKVRYHVPTLTSSEEQVRQSETQSLNEVLDMMKQYFGLSKKVEPLFEAKPSNESFPFLLDPLATSKRSELTAQEGKVKNEDSLVHRGLVKKDNRPYFGLERTVKNSYVDNYLKSNAFLKNENKTDESQIKSLNTGDKTKDENNPQLSLVYRLIGDTIEHLQADDNQNRMQIQNNFRFHSKPQLRVHLSSANADRTFKGDLANLDSASKKYKHLNNRKRLYYLKQFKRKWNKKRNMRHRRIWHSHNNKQANY